MGVSLIFLRYWIYYRDIHRGKQAHCSCSCSVRDRCRGRHGNRDWFTLTFRGGVYSDRDNFSDLEGIWIG